MLLLLPLDFVFWQSCAKLKGKTRIFLVYQQYKLWRFLNFVTFQPQTWIFWFFDFDFRWSTNTRKYIGFNYRRNCPTSQNLDMQSKKIGIHLWNLQFDDLIICFYQLCTSGDQHFGDFSICQTEIWWRGIFKSLLPILNWIQIWTLTGSFQHLMIL